jgi:hypothetical protein
MDALPYGCSLLVSAKACSHVACTCSLTRTVFACTDDSNNADSMRPRKKVCCQFINGNNQRNEQLNNMNNRSIELRHAICVKARFRSPTVEVGGQTNRKIGRAETLDHVELLQCICEYRMKAESTLLQVIDRLVHWKRAVPDLGLLAAAAVFSRSLHFTSLQASVCVPTRTDLSSGSRHSQWDMS